VDERVDRIRSGTHRHIRKELSDVCLDEVRRVAILVARDDRHSVHQRHVQLHDPEVLAERASECLLVRDHGCGHDGVPRSPHFLLHVGVRGEALEVAPRHGIRDLESAGRDQSCHLQRVDHSLQATCAIPIHERERGNRDPGTAALEVPWPVEMTVVQTSGFVGVAALGREERPLDHLHGTARILRGLEACFTRGRQEHEA
jgi:hypothetical protein